MDTKFPTSKLQPLAARTVGLTPGWPRRLAELIGASPTTMSAAAKAGRQRTGRMLTGETATALWELDRNAGRDVSPSDAEPEPVIEVEETDDEIRARIAERFRVMNKLVLRTIEGKIRSLIISGPGGIGKTHPTELALRHSGVPYVVISGSVSAIGLFKAAWEMRNGGLILIDDADGIFDTVDALNLLKAMLDSKKRRVISWLKQAPWMDEDGIEPQFEFCGQVVFISNIDFEGEVDKGHKRAPHLEALLSRSLYCDLEIQSRRDLLIRIENMVVDNEMLAGYGISKEQAQEIVDFMKEHAAKFRSLTLREAVKLANLVNADPEDWRALALGTLSKRSRH